MQLKFVRNVNKQHLDILKVSLTNSDCLFCGNKKCKINGIDHPISQYYIYICDECDVYIEIDYDDINYFFAKISDSVECQIAGDADGKITLTFDNNKVSFDNFSTSEDFVSYIKRLRENVDLL